MVLCANVGNTMSSSNEGGHRQIQWKPFIGTTVGTEGNGPIRRVVHLKGWSKMAPRSGLDYTKKRGNLYMILAFIINYGKIYPL